MTTSKSRIKSTATSKRPTPSDSSQPTNLSLAVIGALFQFMNRYLVGVSDWKADVARYLSYRPLWELTVLGSCAQSIEDIVGGIYPPTPRIDHLVERWDRLSEPERLLIVGDQLLGLDGWFVDTAGGDRYDFLRHIEQLALYEQYYRIGIDDRPVDILPPLEPAHRPQTPRPDRRSIKLAASKRPEMQALAAKLPTRRFRVATAMEVWGFSYSQAQYRLKLLKQSGLITHDGRWWKRTKLSLT